MSADYKFIVPDKGTVQRLADGAFVPWNADGNHPLDEHGSTYARWVADGSPAPAAYVAPQAPLQDEVWPRQFYEQAESEGIITKAEALAFMTSKTLPKILEDPISQLPADQQFAARMALLGSSYSRSNPFTATLGALIQKDAAAMDAFWRAAATR